ncbi:MULTISPECIES: virB8 family protein [unclassified Caulobacter]|jgi:type IV secretion system protein VirB8|uniref:virB8 family protein n=1 Tax=unclassified Caulobacter TaxID=2648921 RepID=UPI00078229DE|nr:MULTISPECIES: VirB8/TrbF family protein [unclassified Caulobacter]AZS19443.1 virB8 family protein [Caulobacter sp. FWC26]OYX34115.1 MAG: virB8 family protein [Caulobacterales bacterium 32-69-10]
MTGVPANDLKAYFDDARRWDQDRLKTAERSKRVAWTVAVLASTVAIAASAAVAALAPLKSVEPYVVRVNQTTGSVDVMTGLTGERGVTYNEAVSKSFLAQYVRAREGYLPPAAQENFQFVTILSTPDEQQRWADLYRATNPQSPQVLVGPDGSATVTIRNITFINDKVANVRFSKTVRLGQEVKVTDWIATLTFAYTKAPMLESDRIRNPLGFQVDSYRADPEISQ